jgi:hypothetical protein
MCQCPLFGLAFCWLQSGTFTVSVAVPPTLQTNTTQLEIFKSEYIAALAVYFSVPETNVIIVQASQQSAEGGATATAHRQICSVKVFCCG